MVKIATNANLKVKENFNERLKKALPYFVEYFGKEFGDQINKNVENMSILMIDKFKPNAEYHNLCEQMLYQSFIDAKCENMTKEKLERLNYLFSDPDFEKKTSLPPAPQPENYNLKTESNKYFKAVDEWKKSVEEYENYQPFRDELNGLISQFNTAQIDKTPEQEKFDYDYYRQETKTLLHPETDNIYVLEKNFLKSNVSHPLEMFNYVLYSIFVNDFISTYPDASKLNLSIADTLFEYGSTRKELLTPSTKHNLVQIYNKLTGKNENYENMLNDGQFMACLNKFRADFFKFGITTSSLLKDVRENADEIFFEQNCPEIIEALEAQEDKFDIEGLVDNIMLFYFGTFSITYAFYLNPGKQNEGHNFIVAPNNISNCALVHEFIHAISHGTDANEKTGLENKQTHENTGLNELLTQYFAQEIDEKMSKDGITIGNKEAMPIDYQELLVYVNDFIVEHKPLLKKLYMSNDIASFEKTFGEKQCKHLYQKLNYFLNLPTDNAAMQKEFYSYYQKYNNDISAAQKAFIGDSLKEMNEYFNKTQDYEEEME